MSLLITTFGELRAYFTKRGLDWDRCAMPNASEVPTDYPVRVSEHYADLVDWINPNDPLRKMVLPSPEELLVAPYELTDPIGDHDREVVPGLIHRYPDRCLLLLTTHCRIHCRFCFRREVVGRVRPVDFAAIRDYLQQHAEVKEIIFSGGDPFTFPAGFLRTVRSHLQPVEHIQTWRFHTRIPVADPDSISQAFFDELKALSNKKVVVVTHADHAREVSPQTEEVVQKLLELRALVLSQSVLLRGVNDSTKELEALFRKLLSVGIKPYYLHHPDKVVGTSHFRVSIERGKELYRALRGNVSTICLPEYVLDFPGGKGKAPVMWLEKTGSATYEVTNFTGERIIYVDPADDEV